MKAVFMHFFPNLNFLFSDYFKCSTYAVLATASYLHNNLKFTSIFTFAKPISTNIYPIFFLIFNISSHWNIPNNSFDFDSLSRITKPSDEWNWSQTHKLTNVTSESYCQNVDAVVPTIGFTNKDITLIWPMNPRYNCNRHHLTIWLFLTMSFHWIRMKLLFERTMVETIQFQACLVAVYRMLNKPFICLQEQEKFI